MSLPFGAVSSHAEISNGTTHGKHTSARLNHSPIRSSNHQVLFPLKLTLLCLVTASKYSQCLTSGTKFSMSVPLHRNEKLLQRVSRHQTQAAVIIPWKFGFLLIDYTELRKTRFVRERLVFKQDDLTVFPFSSATGMTRQNYREKSLGSCLLMWNIWGRGEMRSEGINLLQILSSRDLNTAPGLKPKLALKFRLVQSALG